MSSDSNDQFLQFAVDLAREAGAIIRRYFHDVDQHIALKANDTYVTVADTTVNDLVIRRVTEVYPAHGVLGEEASLHQERRQLWVCDPIDGTNGFTIGEPTAVFSLAYVVDGVPIVAVTYDPFQDRLYTAVKGGGAFCGQQRLQVSQRSFSDKAVIVGPGSFGEIERTVELYHALETAGARVRMFGGLIFKGNIVAEGKVDGILFPYGGAHDIAAVKLIVEEAGGQVTDIYGQEQPYDRPITGAVISNGVIHDELLRIADDFGIEKFLDLGER